MNIIVVAFAVIAFGFVVGYAGWRLLAEYRSAFFTNPRAVMSLDVLIAIVMCGSVPVYIALLCLIAAAAFIFGGVAILIAEALHVAGRL